MQVLLFWNSNISFLLVLCIDVTVPRAQSLKYPLNIRVQAEEGNQRSYRKHDCLIPTQTTATVDRQCGVVVRMPG